MATAHAETSHGTHDAAHGHGAHPPHLAHHFDTPEQQFASGKLGMWAFLATELLMFGGLFCAYAVYRHNHPEVFLHAHHYLDPFWGGVNTAILIASSFTMAWAVRTSQLGAVGLTKLLLALTFLGGVGFTCIKYVEYQSKWQHHLFPGTFNAFNPATPATAPARKEALEYWQKHVSGHSGKAIDDINVGDDKGKAVHHTPEKADVAAQAAAPHIAQGPGYKDPHAGTGDAAKIFPTFVQPAGMLPAHTHTAHNIEYAELDSLSAQRVNTFFGIYFTMTGLHMIHVFVGMGIIAWLFFTAGRYSGDYYTPVDLGGLYWHLVDLIWIFLFPLLYLIH
jgi:cytochrome c oxidase subunit 3